MNTVAYVGRGCKFSLQTGTSPTVYTEVGQISKWDMSGIKANLADVTNLDSPSAFVERIPTTLDPGEITITGILNPANVSIADLLTLCQSQTLSYWQMALSDNVTYIRFWAYVTEYAPASSVEPTKALVFSAKLTITGLVTVGS